MKRLPSGRAKVPYFVRRRGTFGRADSEFSESNLLVAKLADEPGALARVSRELSQLDPNAGATVAA